MTDSLEEFKEDFALIIEAGFIAVRQLDEKSARALFLAAQSLNPQSTASKLGLGYIALTKMETEKAAPLFEEICQSEADNTLAKIFLGICYFISRKKISEGKKMIQEAIEQSEEATIQDLGKQALKWADKDYAKQAKAPFF
ncbi:MAG: SctF chaperone SctG [Parachlamydia sp.]|jgi:lipopolysaccharide biosynthesis regulator YciM|nr:SctF chaperone SctG [Parachlamydia sp.]